MFPSQIIFPSFSRTEKIQFQKLGFTIAAPQFIRTYSLYHKAKIFQTKDSRIFSWIQCRAEIGRFRRGWKVRKFWGQRKLWRTDSIRQKRKDIKLQKVWLKLFTRKDHNHTKVVQCKINYVMNSQMIGLNLENRFSKAWMVTIKILIQI